MQMNPNQNPNEDSGYYEQEPPKVRVHPAEEKLKKVKIVVYACLIMLIVLGSMFAWSYVRLSKCQNVYDQGFNDCVEQVRKSTGQQDNFTIHWIEGPEGEEINKTVQIGMIT